MKRATSVAVVSLAGELGDRVGWWLSREYRVVRAVDPSAPLTVLVLSRDHGRDHEQVEAIRRTVPDGWLVVTGYGDQPPEWAARLVARDRRVVTVFPAAPAVLQVTARSLLNRDP
ncbi:MAG: hypothetical protein KatS3mg060_1252 [Dehalococcoidia bacterium]|nr:MAG: hypothetical protein KatS3mg060_1252 [Dehalococcoidia bacterium]